MDGPRRIIKSFRVNTLEDLQLESASERISEPTGRCCLDSRSNKKAPPSSGASVSTRRQTSAAALRHYTFLSGLEILRVLSYVTRPLLRTLFFGKNSRDWALRFTGAAVDAFVWFDVELIGSLVNAVHGTDVDAASIQNTYARLSDYICHLGLRLVLLGTANRMLLGSCDAVK